MLQRDDMRAKDRERTELVSKFLNEYVKSMIIRMKWNFKFERECKVHDQSDEMERQIQIQIPRGHDHQHF